MSAVTATLILVEAALTIAAQERAALLRRTFDAVCLVESGGDPRAANLAEEALGIAQIRPVMVRDANRILGRRKYGLADRLDPVKSWEMFRLVVRYYYPAGGPEEWARCWNGGPAGPRRRSTLGYWQTVRDRMSL
jgi:hypothetical protein